MDPSIGVLGTYDSKLAELLFLRDEIRLNGYRAITINLGTKERPKAEVDFDLYIRIPDLIQSRDQRSFPLVFLR